MFAMVGGVEAVRAYVIFGSLAVALLAIAGRMTFTELSLQVLVNRLDLGRVEADRLAETVNQIGAAAGDGIDFSRVRAHEATLTTMINERLAQRRFIHHVEVRDRFDVRQFMVARNEPVPPPPVEYRDLLPGDWLSTGEHIVWSYLVSGEGRVGVAVSAAPVIDEVARLQHTLRIRVAVAGGVALAVLVAGFFYVLYLLRKNRRLEQARQSAARASYIGLLASGLAHEIRNPLNAMNMNVQMLEEELAALPGAAEADLDELVGDTKREIERLKELVANFLQYARPQPPVTASHDLNEVVRSIVRFLAPDFARESVELRTDLEPLLPGVEIDETQIRQALINLLVNARQVLDAGGLVVVRTRAGAGGEVVVEVEDNGPGIEPDKQERIFEVFYSSRGGGTGLGLPIARQIVERHGGRIEVDSVPGRGTTFRLRLVRHHERPGAGATPEPGVR